MHSCNIITYGIALSFVSSCIAELVGKKQKLDVELAAVGNNSIECEVYANDVNLHSFVACTFPLDIAAFHMGFKVYVESKMRHQDYTEVITSCYWDQGAVSLQCLGKETGAATGTYDKTTRTATVPVPRSAAKTYFLFCELLATTSVRTRPCQLLTSDDTVPVDCSECHKQIIIISISLTLIFIFVYVMTLFLCRRRCRACRCKYLQAEMKKESSDLSRHTSPKPIYSKVRTGGRAFTSRKRVDEENASRTDSSNDTSFIEASHHEWDLENAGRKRKTTFFSGPSRLSKGQRGARDAREASKLFKHNRQVE